MKKLILSLCCIMYCTVCLAQIKRIIVDKPNTMKHPDPGKKDTYRNPGINGLTDQSQNQTEEQYFLEIIDQKNLEIIGNNAKMLSLHNKVSWLEDDGKQALKTMELLQVIVCNDTRSLEATYADSIYMRIIDELTVDNYQLRSITLLAYNNAFHDQLMNTIRLSRNCSPVLDSLFNNNILQVKETESKHITLSQNQVILPIFPDLSIGTSASGQYMSFIETLVQRYNVPVAILNTYRVQEKQNIPDNNEDQLVKARKLFILYMHAKFKK